MIDFIISEDASILEALALIDKTAHGIVFVVEESGKLSGTLTDGDIRRALLRGNSLESPVSQIMQRKFTSLPVNTPSEVIAKTLSDAIVYIPLLDELGRPVDYASVFRTHRIPVSEPALNGNELAYVVECVKTNWISSQGRFVNEFEKSFSNFHGGLQIGRAH